MIANAPEIETKRYLAKPSLSENCLSSGALTDSVDESTLSGEWLPKRRSGRIVCTMLQVLMQRLNGQPNLLVEHPWRDTSLVPLDQHPVLAELDKIRAWEADLKSGKVRSFTVLAKREGITTARVSQLMRLTRLSATAVTLLRQRLATWLGPKEAFSLRRLQELVVLPEKDQLSAIESFGRQLRRSRYLT